MNSVSGLKRTQSGRRVVVRLLVAPMAAFIAALLPAIVSAEDLLQIYHDARGYDAPYAAARYALDAGREKLPQGRALVLPTLNLSGNTSYTDLDSNSRNASLAPSFERNFRSNSYLISFAQPLYREQNSLQYSQSEFQVKQAEASFGQVGQDLIVRVAQSYFDLLAAQDSLAFIRAQKTAIAEQLTQARRNFEVGAATITDTHEAKARFDLSSALELAAQNDLVNKQRALKQITGKEYTGLKPLRAQVKLAPPNPANMENWVDLARKRSYAVQTQEALIEIASLEVKRNRAANYPTLDLVVTHGQTSVTGSTFSSVGTLQTSSAVGLQFAVPLYAGGALLSREREAMANHEKIKQDLDNARRSSEFSSGQAYLAVINGIAQVAALEQALLSSMSALDSTKLGYKVGVRINIDVLNAQQQLFSTERDLALARYNTIGSQLRLKAAAGALGADDLEEVNRALAQ